MFTTPCTIDEGLADAGSWFLPRSCRRRMHLQRVASFDERAWGVKGVVAALQGPPRARASHPAGSGGEEELQTRLGGGFPSVRDRAPTQDGKTASASRSGTTPGPKATMVSERFGLENPCSIPCLRSIGPCHNTAFAIGSGAVPPLCLRRRPTALGLSG